MEVSFHKHKLARFCSINKINRLALFGSALRGELKPDSDIDLLVEFKKGHVPGYFDLYRMETELAQMFGGRKIDLRTPAELSKYFREEVISASEVLYSES